MGDRPRMDPQAEDHGGIGDGSGEGRVADGGLA